MHTAHKDTSPAGADSRPAPRNLDEAIERAGRTLGDLSHDLRVARESIWAWRRGRSIPRGDHLCKLADLLGLTPHAALALITGAPQAAAAPVTPSNQLEIEEAA